MRSPNATILAVTVFLLLSTGIVHSQSSATITVSDGNSLQWTLPDAGCSYDNYCDIRISPQGAIYLYQLQTNKLYVITPNVSQYHEYDLSGYRIYLGIVLDFVPYDSDQAVIFFSDQARYISRRRLVRYDLSTETMSEISLSLPSGERWTYCNQRTPTLITPLGSILRLGLENQLLACSLSPSRDLTFQIIDVHSLTVLQSIEVVGAGPPFISTYPAWDTLIGGEDGNIYVENSTIPVLYLTELTSNLNPADIPAGTHFIFKYSVSTNTWSLLTVNVAQVATAAFTNPLIVSVQSPLAAVSADGETYQFRLELEDQGGRIVLAQLDSAHSTINPISYADLGGGYVGVTTDGDVLFRTGYQMSDIVVEPIDEHSIFLEPTQIPAHS